MSDEKDIHEVMRAERTGKTTAREKANLRKDMLQAIRDCDEDSFMDAIRALGYTPESVEYKAFLKKFRAHVANRRKL
jgi:hypothetical protein